jgi:hypothetical protein
MSNFLGVLVCILWCLALQKGAENRTNNACQNHRQSGLSVSENIRNTQNQNEAKPE